MSGEIPDTYKNEFNTELTNINFERSRILNIILIMIGLFLFFTDFLNMQKGLLLPGPKYLSYTHLLLISVTLILLIFFRIYKDDDPKYIPARARIVIFFSYFVTLDCTLTSIIDQLIHDQITIIIIGAYGIAVVNYLKPLTSLGMYFSNYLIFAIGVTLLQDNPAIMRGHCINGVILVVVAWFLSVVLYSVKVKDFLSRKMIEQQKVELEKTNQQLTTANQKLQESLAALDESQNIIFTLALALESKDPLTHGHSERVADYAIKLAKYLNLSEVDQVNIYRAAILHDLGKIGVPDAILNKQGELTSEEWSIIKSHPKQGEAICSKLNFAKEILPIIRHHHERYDGRGYPDGLSGEDIPFLARLVCIADAVDAITSCRSYRSAGTIEKALEELRKGSGFQFDPFLVEAFISLCRNK